MTRWLLDLATFATEDRIGLVQSEVAMRWFALSIVCALLVFSGVIAGSRAEETRKIIGADYDPALDGDGTYRGFPSEFEGRYPKGMPPGEGWKVLSGDGWLATSKCIGSFESPECMMDTVLACEMWSNVHAHIEYREGDQRRMGKWHPICGKLEYFGSEHETRFHWRRVFNSGAKHPRHFIVYYKTKRFEISSESAKGYWGIVNEESCKQFNFCAGDIVLVLLRLDCRPNTVEVPGSLADAFYHDYDEVVPISYCDRIPLELALISRRLPRDEGWQWVRLFNPGKEGSGYRGWPQLERVYQSMR